MGRITYAAAGTAALAEEMRRDTTVFEFCTDATESLLEEFGPTRIRTTPITENTFTGMAVGAARWSRPLGCAVVTGISEFWSGEL